MSHTHPFKPYDCYISISYVDDNLQSHKHSEKLVSSYQLNFNDILHNWADTFSNLLQVSDFREIRLTFSSVSKPLAIF